MTREAFNKIIEKLNVFTGFENGISKIKFERFVRIMAARSLASKEVVAAEYERFDNDWNPTQRKYKYHIGEDDATEVTFYQSGPWSVYLAVYQGQLMWTLSEHYYPESEVLACQTEADAVALWQVQNTWDNFLTVPFELPKEECGLKYLQAAASAALVKGIFAYTQANS